MIDRKKAFIKLTALHLVIFVFISSLPQAYGSQEILVETMRPVRDAMSNKMDSGGLNRFDLQTKTFTHYRHDIDEPNSLSHDWVKVFHEDRQGVLWIGTWGVLNRFGPQTETFTHYRHDADEPNSLNEDRVTAPSSQSTTSMPWLSSSSRVSDTP